MSTTKRACPARPRPFPPFRPLTLGTCLILGLAAAGGCGSWRNPTPAAEDDGPGAVGPHSAAAIRTILIEDDELGRLRNHACETRPLSTVIRFYVVELDALDLSRTPADFSAAFRRHRDVWASTIEFFENYDQLRGEIHGIFNEIHAQGGRARSSMEAIEADIATTWAEVEDLAIAYGALAPRPES